MQASEKMRKPLGVVYVVGRQNLRHTAWSPFLPHTCSGSLRCGSNCCECRLDEMNAVESWHQTAAVLTEDGSHTP